MKPLTIRMRVMLSNGSVHTSFPSPEWATVYLVQFHGMPPRVFWGEGENIHSCERADKGSTSICILLVFGVPVAVSRWKHTIVITIVPSSHPNWPPQQRNRAMIRRTNATTTTTSPATPRAPTICVRSRTGAWHAVAVTFFVAEGLSATDPDWESRQIPRAHTEGFLDSAAEFHADIHIRIESGICAYTGLIGHGASGFFDASHEALQL